MSILPSVVRKEAMEGEPGEEFSIEEMVILPETDLWHLYRAEAYGIVYTFMSKVESSSQDETFPFLILSAEVHLSPPAPAKEMQSRIYDRVLSCLELKDHPGSKAKRKSLTTGGKILIPFGHHDIAFSFSFFSIIKTVLFSSSSARV